MKKRCIEYLILEDEDYNFDGDLEITKYLLISNGHSLTVSGKLSITTDCCDILICGKIIAGSLYIKTDGWFSVLIINSGYINVLGDFVCNCPISSNGNIIVHGNSDIDSVHCLNFLVDGNNSSLSIKTEEDIYILGNNNSLGLEGRDIFIEGNSDSHSFPLKAWKSAEIAGKVYNCPSIQVEK